MSFPYPLVETEWLAAHLRAPDVRIIDGSWRMPGGGAAREDFDKRRIPGAVFFDIDAVADTSADLPHMAPAPQVFAAAMEEFGVSPEDRVVVYDDAGIFSAARVWWTFRAMGHDKASVLNGGLPKWLSEGRETESGAPAPRKTDYKVRATADIVRDASDVRRALETISATVLDARPAARFKGEAPEPRAGLRAGAMPGAVNIPASDLLTAEKTLKPTPELEKIFAAAGVNPEKPVITTCGSGVTAAIISLALEQVGHRRHALYDGSWAEWGREDADPALYPVVARTNVAKTNP